jgi:hypothetical protein
MKPKIPWPLAWVQVGDDWIADLNINGIKLRVFHHRGKDWSGKDRKGPPYSVFEPENGFLSIPIGDVAELRSYLEGIAQGEEPRRKPVSLLPGWDEEL